MSYSNYYTASTLFHGSLSSIMGTQLDVLLFGTDPDKLAVLWAKLESEVVRLDKMLNRFDPDSDVSRLNREAAVVPIPVKDELWNMLVDCRRYFLLTNGLFDITLYDFNAVFLSEKEKSVFFTVKNLSVDFGGYAKGYALQQIDRLLKKEGMERALVNFGNSSVLAIGSHPLGAYWQIGIDNPYCTGEQLRIVNLCNTSLSTSGNMPMHPRHIINPLTQEYIAERKIVSVVADNPVDAEVLTTVLMIAHEETIVGIAAKFDIKEKHIYIV